MRHKTRKARALKVCTCATLKRFLQNFEELLRKDLLSGESEILHAGLMFMPNRATCLQTITGGGGGGGGGQISQPLGFVTDIITYLYIIYSKSRNTAMHFSAHIM